LQNVARALGPDEWLGFFVVMSDVLVDGFDQLGHAGEHAYEKDATTGVRLMYQSYKAAFIPATSALGLILGQGYGVSKDFKKAEQFFLRALAMGHIPAPMLLCRFYTLGKRGVFKQIVGILFFTIAGLYAGIMTRFFIFPVYSFRHFRSNVPPMFNERL
jgi:hypothetical protein